jgi:hypothetical protein
MDGTFILNTASSMLETFGENAKFHIAEEMDRAMEAGDGAAYDQWCLVAKAVELMTMTRKENAAAKPEKTEKADKTPTIGRTFRAA